VVITVPGDPGELEGALDHAERRVAVAVHDPVAEGAVVCSDAHRDAELFAQMSRAARTPSRIRSSSSAYCGVGVFADGELLFVSVVAGIDADFFDPLRGFERGVGFEMNVSDDSGRGIPVARNPETMAWRVSLRL